MAEVEINKIVAHFRDGTLLKGTTRDFSPNRPAFHVQPMNGSPGIQVMCRKLKALFFVRDLSGDPTRVDLQGFLRSPLENAHGRKIAVKFKDAELLCGYTMSFTSDRDGFFVLPADGRGNNIRVYVLRVACDEVQAGPAADEFARRELDAA